MKLGGCSRVHLGLRHWIELQNPTLRATPDPSGAQPIKLPAQLEFYFVTSSEIT